MSLDVSVIITNYNNSKYIGRAIRSCLKQSLPKERYEVIVVDDCSTDESRQVIEGFEDRVVPIFLQENQGVAEASNTGIRKALGRFIIRVDSDDYVNENLFLFMSEILNFNHDIGFVYGDLFKVDENEKILERVDLNTVDLILRHGAGIMFRKSYLETIGLYDKTLRNAEDFDLIKRYLKNFDGYHLRIPGYRYRQHATNMTKDEAERKKWEELSTSKLQS